MSKEYEFESIVQSMLFGSEDINEIKARGRYLKSIIDKVVETEVEFKTGI